MKSVASSLHALCGLYGQSVMHATKALYRGWPLIPLSIAAFALFLLVATVFSGMGLAGGFIIGIASIVLLSFYYSWLSKAHAKEKLTFENIREFDGMLFSSILNASFILFPLSLVVHMLRGNPDTVWISYCFTLALAVLLNPIAEIIHIERTDGFSALFRSYSFVLNNWIEWFLPIALMMLPLAVHGTATAVHQLSSTDPLLPVLVVVSSMRVLFAEMPVLGIVSGVILANWFMLFRAALFEKLENGSHRQRAFMARQ
ncbi:MAG: hypothetical protein QY326_04835 [Bdellovibrionota bacterium]|nr:MAG: hypothetical protein QY326_04835 [Bdellovibrionota bacterium]